MSTKLVGVEPDRGLGRVNRLADLAVASCPWPAPGERLLAADQQVIERRDGLEFGGELLPRGPGRRNRWSRRGKPHAGGGSPTSASGSSRAARSRILSPSRRLRRFGEDQEQVVAAAFDLVLFVRVECLGKRLGEAPGGRGRLRRSGHRIRAARTAVAEGLLVLGRVEHHETRGIELGFVPQGRGTSGVGRGPLGVGSALPAPFAGRLSRSLICFRFSVMRARANSSRGSSLMVGRTRTARFGPVRARRAIGPDRLFAARSAREVWRAKQLVFVIEAARDQGRREQDARIAGGGLERVPPGPLGPTLPERSGPGLDRLTACGSVPGRRPGPGPRRTAWRDPCSST